MTARLTWLAAAFIAALAVAASAQNVPSFKTTLTKTDRFDFGSGGTIAVTGAPTGSIKIIGSTKNEIEIVAQISAQAANEADARKIAENSGYVTDESRVRVAVISIGGYNKFGGKKLPKDVRKDMASAPVTIDYTITVPRYSDLEIDGGKGGVSVSGVDGNLRINSLEGDSVIDGAASNAVVSVGSGSLSIGFTPRGWHGRMADVQVASGDLTVRLPSSFHAEVDANVMRIGSVENLIADMKPRDRKVPFTERSVAAKYGLGGPPLRFVVGSGKIKLERLN